jgi:sirohydrochlorin ferrochelatase
MPCRLYQSLDPPSLVRLRVTPDEPVAPDAFPKAASARGSRQPHADVRVAQVRQLIETTTLTYGEITIKTGVCRAGHILHIANLADRATHYHAIADDVRQLV